MVRTTRTTAGRELTATVTKDSRGSPECGRSVPMRLPPAVYFLFLPLRHHGTRKYTIGGASLAIQKCKTEWEQE